jgi:hypothetical protein
MLLKGGGEDVGRLTEALLAEHRPVLFRYALLQLRDDHLAEDAVQETLLAASIKIIDLVTPSKFPGEPRDKHPYSPDNSDREEKCSES